MKKILLLALIFSGWHVAAQDPFFSQYFHAPVFLNPALAGTSKQDLRVTILNRRQWMNVPSGINHAAVSIEKNITQHDWSLAAAFNTSTEGYLNTNQASVTVAKGFNGANFQYDCTEPYISVGLQLGFIRRNARMDKLWFSNQIDRDGLILGAQPAINYLPYAEIVFGNASMGVAATFKKFMLGAAFYRPVTLNWERTLIDGIASDSARLPRRSTFHLSYFYEANDLDPLSLKIKPTAIVQVQGGRWYANVGAVVNLPQYPIEMGCWYRYSKGIKATHGLAVGVNVLLGRNRSESRYSKTDQYDTEFIRMGTSYDFELTGPRAGNTGGSFEIGGVYERMIDENKCRQRPDCSKLYPWMFF